MKEILPTQKGAFHIHSNNILHCLSGTEVFLSARKHSSNFSEIGKIFPHRAFCYTKIFGKKVDRKLRLHLDQNQDVGEDHSSADVNKSCLWC